MFKLFFLIFLILIPFVSADLERSYICEKTLQSIQEHTSSQFVVNEILFEKKVGIDINLINQYRENWENICSEETGLTLKSKELCNSLYFLILETNYGYLDNDLIKISETLTISLKSVQNYLLNYYELCYSKGFSAALPEKKYEEVTINKTENCLKESGDFFNFAVPLPEIYVGTKCGKVKFFNYFLRYEEFNGQFRITGIRFYWMGLILLILLTWALIAIISQRNKTGDFLEAGQKSLNIFGEKYE